MQSPKMLPPVEQTNTYSVVARFLGSHFENVRPYTRDERGGVFALFDARHSVTVPVMTLVVGDVSPQRFEKELKHSLSSGTTLLQCPEEKNDAVRVGDFVLAFGGLFMLCNEALMLLVAKSCRHVLSASSAATEVVIGSRENEIFKKVLETGRVY